MKKNKKKYNIGLTFGAFEHFHYGHVNLLKNAKVFCNKLVVCISDDKYVEIHKNHKPILSLRKRKIILESIKYVDKVDRQSCDFTKIDALKKYNAEVLFVGDDWGPQTYAGEGLGVPVIYLPYTRGISSTKLRKKLELANKK